MDVLTEVVRDGSLMELLLYADDLALCEDSLDKVKEKYERWKKILEGKYLRGNVGKTKGLQLLYGKKDYGSKLGSSGVCGERVGYNFVGCNVNSRLISVIQMYLGGSVYFHVKRFLSVGCVWVITAP